MKLLNDKKFKLFIFVGILNTLNFHFMHIILMNFFEIGMAHSIAYYYSVLSSYILTTKIIYNEDFSLNTFFLFPLTKIPEFLLSLYGMLLIVQYTSIQESYASLITMLVAVPISYSISRIIFLK